MASPAVAATTEGALGSAGTNVAVTLPGGGSASDGYLVVIAKGATAATINALTDWTEVLDENAVTGLAVLWYTGTGVPANPTFVQSASTRSAWAAYRITGTDRAALPTVGTTATGSSTAPDPPAATVTGGPKDILSIAVFSRGGEIADDDTVVTTFPTSYTLGQVEKSAGTAGTNLAGIIGSAARQVSAASSENPGTFTIITGAWRAQTIIVYPGSPITVNGGVAPELDSGPAGKVLQTYTASPAAESDSVLGGSIIQPQLIAGGVSGEADSAPSGAVIQPQIVAGGVGGETGSVPAASVRQVYAGGVAAEADSVPSGVIIQPQLVSGGAASESDSAPAGTVRQIYTASSAGEADSVPAGKVQQTYVAGSASESDSALAGGVAETFTASFAAESNSVPAGKVRQVYVASVAAEANAAAGGQVLQVYVASPASEADTAPSGSIDQGAGGGTTVDGGVASEGDGTLAGLVAQIYTAGPAQEADAAIAAAVAEIYSSGRAAETDSVPGGAPLSPEPQVILAAIAGEQDRVPAGLAPGSAWPPGYPATESVGAAVGVASGSVAGGVVGTVGTSQAGYARDEGL